MSRRPGTHAKAENFSPHWNRVETTSNSKQQQLTAPRYCQELRQRFEDWREVACLKPAT